MRPAPTLAHRFPPQRHTQGHGERASAKTLPRAAAGIPPPRDAPRLAAATVALVGHRRSAAPAPQRAADASQPGHGGGSRCAPCVCDGPGGRSTRTSLPSFAPRTSTLCSTQPPRRRRRPRNRRAPWVRRSRAASRGAPRCGRASRRQHGGRGGRKARGPAGPGGQREGRAYRLDISRLWLRSTLCCPYCAAQALLDI